MDIDDALSLCSLCKLVKDGDSEECEFWDDCDEGIQINGLYSYNVANNYYEIFISSTLKRMKPNDQIIAFERIIQGIASMTNDADGIYATAGIQVLPIYNKTNLTQPKGTFTINFDPGLMIDDDAATVSIDFYIWYYNEKLWQRNNKDTSIDED